MNNYRTFPTQFMNRFELLRFMILSRHDSVALLRGNCCGWTLNFGLWTLDPHFSIGHYSHPCHALLSLKAAIHNLIDLSPRPAAKRTRSPQGRGMPKGQRCRRACRIRCFTAIELIGVLAVIALLATALMPNVIRRIDRAAWEREKADLQTMADSFTASILHNKSIPDYSGISSAIAKEMSLSLSAITTTPRRWTRAFIVDRNLSINNSNVLPYNQTNTGSLTPPSNARVIIVSTLAGKLPVASTNNLFDTDFKAIWDCPEGAQPATPSISGWPKGEDVLIKKIDLGPLFYQLVLINHDQPVPPPQFSIEGTITNVPPGGLGWNSYYLDTSLVGLLDTAGAIQVHYLLKRSIGFVFESGAWRGQIEGGQTHDDQTAIDFFNHAFIFLQQPTSPSGTNNGATPFSAMLAVYTFMFDYTLWADECPHFDNHQNSGNSIPEYKMLNDQGQGGNNGSIYSTSSGLVK